MRETRDANTSGAALGRRVFLRSALAGGALLAAESAGALAGGGGGSGDPPVPPTSFEYEEATVADLQTAMESGKVSARSLAEAYLKRIDELNERGPALRAVIEANPDALEIADALDRERKDAKPRGPLHGIPVLIKDNIGTHDRMTTTAGSLALAGSIPARDAFVAERLRSAGAVILGKANLSEWANFRSTHSTSGWSGRGGQCRNPYALDRTPSGSSSGSAVAVSANLAAVAVGTETDGSVVAPSSACSIVGIKPTLGLVSRSGIIPIAHSQDTAGPMARTVRDAAVLLGALAGIDPSDPATTGSRGKAQTDYTIYLDANGLGGARIGVARKLMGFNDRVDALVGAALDAMKKLGAVIVDPADLANSGTGDAELEVLLFEFKADLNAYLAGLGPDAPVRTLQDAIDFNDKHRDREMPYFGQEIFVRAQAKGPLTSKEYRAALAKSRRLARDIDALMDKHHLDAIVAPTAGPPSLIDLVNGDYGAGGSSSPAAIAGYPHITVPGGYAFGLPVGLSFFGRAYSEPVLLKLAYAYEQATRLRRPPTFLPTADL